MDTYLTIMVTVLVATQVIRIAQNTIQLHRQNKLIKKEIAHLGDVTQEDFDNQRKAYKLAIDCPLHIAATIDQILDFVPSADVVNVKHGRWEPGNSICPVCGEDKFNGLDADIWSDWTPKYCPNCGALMDLKEETEFGTTL